MKIKTSELEGAALDWAVLISIGGEYDIELSHSGLVWGTWSDLFMPHHFSPSTEWSQGGPLIEKNNWALPYRATNRHHIGKYEACTPGGFPHNGATPLIASMRAIAAAELGDTVDVPDELM